MNDIHEVLEGSQVSPFFSGKIYLYLLIICRCSLRIFCTILHPYFLIGCLLNQGSPAPPQPLAMAPIASATDLRKIPRIPSTAPSIRATLWKTLLQSTTPSSVRSAYRGCWWNRAHEEDVFGGAAAELDCDDTSSIRTVVPHVLEMMEEEDEGHMTRQGEQQRHEEEEPLRCQSSRI